MGLAARRRFRFIAELGFSYVIRVKGDVWIECRSYRGRLKDYPLLTGQTFKLTQVRYHKTKRLELKLAQRLCADREESEQLAGERPTLGCKRGRSWRFTAAGSGVRKAFVIRNRRFA